MSYTGFVCQIKNLRNHPNGDNLYLGECFGNTVAVSRNGYTPGMTGVYFPTDGQLSVEFATKNNLLRLKDENGHSIPGGGYMDPDKRNVTAIKLRGVKSDGLFLPLSCLDYCFEDGAAAHLKIGDTIDVVNGHDICTKYIPRGSKRVGRPTDGNRTRKKRVPIAPLFVEHADTEQLAYNLGAFRSGDEVEITLKMHGTSQRTGFLPVFSGFRRTIWDKLFRRDGEPIYTYDIVTGTRRTVINGEDGGYYGSNAFRMPHSELFRGKLWKGETVYYEVVGFTDSGVPIMAECGNKKLNDKDFVKQYGQTTTFSYGCEPHPFNTKLEDNKPQSDIYVYRMTMTNEDGNVVEYTPDFMRYRCEQMGVKTVPVFWKGTIPEHPASADDPTIEPGEWIKNVAERFYDGPDPIGKTHIREGVVVRILNKPKFCAYKHKNWYFKALEGIVKVEAEAPDMEEADGLEEEVVDSN
jgi:hypothetical protein